MKQTHMVPLYTVLTVKILQMFIRLIDLLLIIPPDAEKEMVLDLFCA